jgi:hypothetical protein
MSEQNVEIMSLVERQVIIVRIFIYMHGHHFIKIHAWTKNIVNVLNILKW